MSSGSQPPVEIVIEPTRGFRFVSWRDLHAYRDLLWLLVWRDFATRYKQTILGPLWHIFQPLLTTVIFTVVFSQVAELPTDGLPPDCHKPSPHGQHSITVRRKPTRCSRRLR